MLLHKTPLASRRLSWIGLDGDGTLIVAFIDGAVVRFPGTIPAHYDALRFAVSAGRWIATVLRDWPYVRMAPPLYIPGLFNTGVDDARMTLDPSSCTDDPHYGVKCPDDATASVWLPNDATSRWIARNCAGTAPLGTYDYSLTIFVDPGIDPAHVNITGRWSCDDDGLDIFVNGTSTGNTFTGGATGGDHWEDFTLAAGFVVGSNTVTFRVQQTGVGAGPADHGLRVEFTDAVLS